MAKPKKQQEVKEKLSGNEKLKKMFDIFKEQDKNYAAFKQIRTVVRCIDSGSPKINESIGIPGLPCGRISQIYGPMGSGKSFLAMILAKNAIKARPDSVVVWFDSERSFNYDWARQLGLYSDNPEDNKLIVIKASDGVEIFERIYGKIRKDKFAGCKKTEPGILDHIIAGNLDCSLIIIDSIASIITPKEKFAPVGSATIGALASFLTAELRRISEDLEKSGAALLLINQVRENIGDEFERYHSPGGCNLMHQISTNIFIERISRMDALILEKDGDKNTLLGQKVKVIVKKTRFGPAPRTCETTFLFAPCEEYPQIGIVNADLEILELAVKKGIVMKGGAGWYTLPNGKKMQGDKAVQEEFNNDPQLLEQITKELYSKGTGILNDDGSFTIEENFDDNAQESCNVDDSEEDSEYDPDMEE